MLHHGQTGVPGAEFAQRAAHGDAITVGLADGARVKQAVKRDRRAGVGILVRSERDGRIGVTNRISKRQGLGGVLTRSKMMTRNGG